MNLFPFILFAMPNVLRLIFITLNCKSPALKHLSIRKISCFARMYYDKNLEGKQYCLFQNSQKYFTSIGRFDLINY